jgi:hypothetical protein
MLHTVRPFYCVGISILAVNYENDEQFSIVAIAYIAYTHKSSSCIALKLGCRFSLTLLKLNKVARISNIGDATY